MQEFLERIGKVCKLMKETDTSIASVTSGTALFLQYITFAHLEYSVSHLVELDKVKQIMIKRGRTFLQKAGESRDKIAQLASSFILDGSKLLVHSYSRVILHALLKAAMQNKHFHVYITESLPDKSGYLMAKALKEKEIPCCIILDSAVGYIMEDVDFVMLGAEGVVENGGIINKIGSCTVATCAKAANKEVYVLAESFKFVRLYPLNQKDLPEEFKFPGRHQKGLGVSWEEHPVVDYTPPALISLLLTDLGILTPSAVSDELIKLYQ
ncbi:unnamed protein product [Darwinula stevensoni]|uniref:Translation initiation factor eIF2B subunit alpha n=1 Tax=Darwinula stevensoni TaxID=69355 RepID=A0A7R9FN88_9CRUS|nr:unnamed protein product [Darwinula stevensoni]CAG0896229.1 unnamed protein product [Darwinula stevensoni]